MDLRNLTVVAVLLFCPLFPFQAPAHAQQADVAFGINTLTAPPDTSASGNHFPQSLTGGFYPSLGGDVLFFHHLGVGGGVSWRASRSFFQGIESQPFRPVFYDFNLVYAPPLGHLASLDLTAGIGVESLRFYQNTYICDYNGCRNYVSSNHFLGQFGAGLRLYPHGNFFIEPQVHVYLVRNNLEFSAAHATRFGVSIGYTFGSH